MIKINQQKVIRLTCKKINPNYKNLHIFVVKSANSTFFTIVLKNIIEN